MNISGNSLPILYTWYVEPETFRKFIMGISPVRVQFKHLLSSFDSQFHEMRAYYIDVAVSRGYCVVDIPVSQIYPDVGVFWILLRLGPQLKDRLPDIHTKQPQFQIVIPCWFEVAKLPAHLIPREDITGICARDNFLTCWIGETQNNLGRYYIPVPACTGFQNIINPIESISSI